MLHFNDYFNIMGRLEEVKGLQAYWQAPENVIVEMGVCIEPVTECDRFKGIENIFENARPKQLPSRINSLCVATTPTFKNTLPIYECVIEGSVFYADLRKFNEAVHANDTESINMWAEKYWDGASNKKDKYTEIIVNGTVTIIKEYK
jgi:hypothetical protein